MTRSTTDRKEPRRQRFSGPWNPNPWISSRTIGPRNYQGIDRQQARACRRRSRYLNAPRQWSNPAPPESDERRTGSSNEMR